MAPEPLDDPFAGARKLMVLGQIEARGVRDPRVLEAMRQVPRHRFLPPSAWPQAHADHPLPLGPGQTLSQPYIVATMAEALTLGGGEKVLEVGSGSGYAAAVLAQLVGLVCGLELDEALCLRSRATLQALGCTNVRVRCGDGNLGWPEEAPFEAIQLSCAAPEIPEALWAQLTEGGRLLLPLGHPGEVQRLVLATKAQGRPRFQVLEPVAFVPLLRH